MDIICKRLRDGAPYVNIKQKKAYHNPDGFEWRYGGSGPADLALKILLYFIDYRATFRLYHDFKWEFIESMPEEGGIIYEEEILSWLKKKS